MPPFTPAAIKRKEFMKDIFIIDTTGERTYWNKVGLMFDPNKDGSINIKLNMFPGVIFQSREQKSYKPAKDVDISGAVEEAGL